MSTALVYSRAQSGIDAISVTVEVHIANGMPKFLMVGLPETVVKESKERVRSAILNSGFDFPSRRITVNLAPADLPKQGGRFDLPIAIGILKASKQIPFDEKEFSMIEMAGELALTGEIREFAGSLPFALACAKSNKSCIIPAMNVHEAAVIADEVCIFAANHLLEVTAHFQKSSPLAEVPLQNPQQHVDDKTKDMSDIIGQHAAKRAIVIAAAGGHNMLMMGPPGSGKTMLASRFASILPPLTKAQALEVAAVYSLSGKFNPKHWGKVPFRQPHHSASAVALVGGSNPPKPGEISLAHHGVLFLDECPEFKRSVLEALREPLELGCVSISRAASQMQFPAQFQLIAAMNPCPCGYYRYREDLCQCTSQAINRYRQRLSGPFLDRIDIQLEVTPESDIMMPSSLSNQQSKSGELRERVIEARTRQHERSQCLNSQLGTKELATVCELNLKQQQWLSSTLDKLHLSTRAYHRILRLARTIADLEEKQKISDRHLQEAIQYRRPYYTITTSLI